MNSGAQTVPESNLTHNSSRNSSGHKQFKPSQVPRAKSLFAHKAWLLHFGSTSIFPISRLSEQRNEMKSIRSYHDRISARSVVRQHRKSRVLSEHKKISMNVRHLCLSL